MTVTERENNKMEQLLVWIIMAFVSVLSIAGCSNKSLYESLQTRERNDCMKLPLSQYEACMESANKPYEEYQRERQENLKNGPALQ